MTSQNTTIKNALPNNAQNLIEQTTMFNNMAMDANDKLFKPCLGSLKNIPVSGDGFSVATDVLDSVKDYSAKLSKVLNTELDDIICDVAKMDADKLSGLSPDLPSFDFSKKCNVDRQIASTNISNQQLEANGMRLASNTLPLNTVLSFNPASYKTPYTNAGIVSGYAYSDNAAYLTLPMTVQAYDSTTDKGKLLTQVPSNVIFDTLTVNKCEPIYMSSQLNGPDALHVIGNLTIKNITRGPTQVCYDKSFNKTLREKLGDNYLSNIENITVPIDFVLKRNTTNDKKNSSGKFLTSMCSYETVDLKIYDCTKKDLIELSKEFQNKGIAFEKVANIKLAVRVIANIFVFLQNYTSKSGATRRIGDCEIQTLEFSFSNVIYNYNYVGIKDTVGSHNISNILPSRKSMKDFTKNVAIGRLKSQLIHSSFGQSIIKNNIDKFSSSIPGLSGIDCGEATSLVSGEISRNAISAISDGEVSLDKTFVKSLANTITNGSINNALYNMGIPVALDNECTKAVIDKIANQMPSIDTTSKIFSFGDLENTVPIDTSTLFAKTTLDDMNSKFSEVIDSDCIRAINTQFDAIDSNIAETALSVKDMYESDTKTSRDTIDSANRLGDGAKTSVLNALNQK